MIINFNEIPTQTLSALHGGEGDVVAKVSQSAMGRAEPCTQ